MPGCARRYLRAAAAQREGSRARARVGGGEATERESVVAHAGAASRGRTAASPGRGNGARSPGRCACAWRSLVLLVHEEADVAGLDEDLEVRRTVSNTSNNGAAVEAILAPLPEVMVLARVRLQIDAGEDVFDVVAAVL